MTTTPTVIRDGIDPMIVTTKFDVDHEYDAETTDVTFVDITAKMYVQHGDSAIGLDFGVFGNVVDDYLEKEYQQEVNAIDALIMHLQQAKNYLMEAYAEIKAR